MYWNAFLSWCALVGGLGLAWFVLMEIGEWSSRRHEYRMAQLRQSNVVPIRKDIA